MAFSTVLTVCPALYLQLAKKDADLQLQEKSYYIFQGKVLYAMLASQMIHSK